LELNVEYKALVANPKFVRDSLPGEEGRYNIQVSGVGFIVEYFPHFVIVLDKETKLFHKVQYEDLKEVC